MIAVEDGELYKWLLGITEGIPYRSGDFLQSVAVAAFRADYENYPILRPALLQLKAKYPVYVKKET